MGVVYAATQTSLDRSVALKVIRSGSWASPSQVDRFLREQTVLARLRHPNIAQVFDAGVDDGVPFFAMERVEGEPLDAWCDHRALSLRDRLALFQDVCTAVQVAHQSLVVHCDLKPTNVLVEDGEGRPRVKLLDFGLARLLDEAGARTRTGERALTPEYAAPEQIQGADLTTAVDIYALGVILYELASGARPPAPGPDSPSTPPSLASAVTDEAAAARSMPAPKLRRRLREDLDRIVRRALHADPTRRYASAGDLADDIGRWLDGLPVEARPDALTYRSGLFVRRHARALAVGRQRARRRPHGSRPLHRSSGGGPRSCRDGPRAGRADDGPRRRPVRAGRPLERAGPGHHGPGGPRPRLGRARHRQHRYPRRRPRGVALHRRRDFTWGLGLYDEAEAVYRQADAIWQRFPGDTREWQAKSAYNRGLLALGRAEPEEGTEQLETALRLQRDVLFPSDPALWANPPRPFRAVWGSG